MYIIAISGNSNIASSMDQFYAVHSALHVVFALLSIIPIQGLCGLHIVALLLVKDKTTGR